MGYQDYISEIEAATISGVSVDTLNRFAEVGYLQIERDSDGLRLFSKHELSEVFGVRDDLNSGEGTEEINLADTQDDVKVIDVVLNGEQSSGESASPKSSSQASTNNGRSASRIDQELFKLRSIVDMQEKVIAVRESEIKDLKEQRDWLKSRVEKLENKADRDQLLLLHETQMVRQLILSQGAKRSTLRTALEWLGFAQQQAPAPATVVSLPTKVTTSVE